jgi:hypothetical protein
MNTDGRTQRTPERDEAFLRTLHDGWSVRKACERSGYGRSSVYQRREADPDFAAAWEDAVALGTDLLEDAAMERALNGSDNMLVFLLRARRPSVYREKHEAKAEGPTNITVRWTERARGRRSRGASERVPAVPHAGSGTVGQAPET